jgi:hypothetical protein
VHRAQMKPTAYLRERGEQSGRVNAATQRHTQLNLGEAGQQRGKAADEPLRSESSAASCGIEPPAGHGTGPRGRRGTGAG